MEITMKEYFSPEERKTARTLYGADSDEVCYAIRRLEKIDTLPYFGSGQQSDIEIYRGAMKQAAETGKCVGFYLKETGALFLAHVDNFINHMYDKVFIEYRFNELVKNKDNARWDKPIEQQKKEQEFDRFQNHEYGLNLFLKWDAVTLEERYAAERLERMGVIPYEGERVGDASAVFASVVQEATKTGKKHSVNLCFGDIRGLFVVPPLKEGESAEEMYDRYVKDQKRLRWDKPIEQQKAEELVLSYKLHGKTDMAK